MNEEDYYDFIDIILKNNSDINLEKIIDILNEVNLKIDYMDYYVFVSAAKYNNMNIINEMEKYDINRDMVYAFCLMSASGMGHMEMVKYFLPKSIIMDDSINNALEAGYIDIAKLLVDYRKKAGTSIIIACEKGYYGFVKYIIDKCDPSIHHNYALKLSVLNGYEEIVKLLLNHPKVNPNDYIEYEESSSLLKKIYDCWDISLRLHHVQVIEISIEKKHYNIIKLLLNHPKVDINICDKYIDNIVYDINMFKIFYNSSRYDKNKLLNCDKLLYSDEVREYIELLS